jgi:hypothetical protein
MRYEAQEAARAWVREAEFDAQRRVEEAERSSEELVLSRLRRLSELSREIHERYQGILDGLERVEAAGGEARLLVDALGRAAQRLSREIGPPAEPTPIRPTPAGLAADASVDRVQ